MKNSINNKNEDINEISADYESICTICNKLFNDPQSLSCGHIFCRQCITQEIEENQLSCPICQQAVTINNFPEINHTVHKISMKYNEDKQTTLHSQNIHNPINEASSAIDVHCLSSDITLHQNEQQNQYSAARLFEPFRDLLSDLINQNKQLREEINQIKKHCHSQLNEYSEKKAISELRSKIKRIFALILILIVGLLIGSILGHNLAATEKNEELQPKIVHLVEQNEKILFEIEQPKKQSPLQSEKSEELLLEIDQLKKQDELQLTGQVRKNEEIQLAINQPNETSAKHRTDIDKLQTDNQNQNIKIQEIDQRHNLLEMSGNTLRDKVKYLPKQQIFTSNLTINQTWKQYGTTKAGGHGRGNGLNQLSHPWRVLIDDDQTIYVADYWNNRIVEWKSDANNGQIVAGGNGQGNRNDQLNGPTKVIVDKKNDSLIICDYGNRRVVRWPRRNGRSGETLISNIDCVDLVMNNDGYLYVSDEEKHEVRRWKMGETNETIVFGGNGRGYRLDQFNHPQYIFIDEDHSVYVSDKNNHRVMKWVKGAKEGIVVAGGQGEGNGLRQLSYPRGIIVDQLGSVYVADRGNHRVIRWLKGEGAQEGAIVVGGNGRGDQPNQFNWPTDLSFDRQKNLYVVDRSNHRIQKFDVNST